MRIKLVRTSLAMPEQYDTFDESGEQVGYLRLRHSRFRVDFPGIGGPIPLRTPARFAALREAQRQHVSARSKCLSATTAPSPSMH